MHAGFDPELLAMLPPDVEAVVFLFPITEVYEKFKDEEEAHLIKLEQSISPDVVFFKQTIANACGMIALLHSVASNDDEIVGKVRQRHSEKRGYSWQCKRSWFVQQYH